MQISSQDLDGFTQSVSFQFDAAEMDQKLNRQLNELRRTVRISGFRKGKVPLKMIRQRYGANIINDLQSEAVERSWVHLVRELKMTPLSQPELDISQPLKPSKGLEFTFSFEIIPPFELPNPSDLNGELIKWTVSEDRLNSEIEELCKRHGDWVPLKRRKKSRNDDQVTISLTGFNGDEEIDALRSDKEQFVLGTSQIIPELEKKILGLKVSESFQLDYTFPEDHHNPDLAGQTVQFRGEVTDICERVVLSVDQLIEKLPNDEDEAALRTRLTTELTTEAEQRSRADLRESIAKQLREESQFPVPPLAVDEQTTARLQHQSAQASEGGPSEEPTEEALAEAKLEAERDLRFEAIIREYSQANQITVTEADFTGRLLEMLRSSGEFGMQLIQFYQQPANRKRLEAAILDDKVIDGFISAAGFTEVEKELTLEEE